MTSEQANKIVDAIARLVRAHVAYEREYGRNDNPSLSLLEVTTEVNEAEDVLQALLISE